MVMSAITVRSNVKMMFDQGSANKMQADYMGRLTKMEKAAKSKTIAVNKSLISQHKGLVKRLTAENKTADETLDKQTSKIAKQVRSRAASAMNALKPSKTLRKTDKAAYAAAKTEHEKTLKAMESANRRYALKAKALGLQARGGKNFSTNAFLKNEAADRRMLISLQKQQINATKVGSRERRVAKLILNEMIAGHEMLNAEEIKNTNIKKTNNRLMAQSSAFTSRAIAQNNAHYREQIALLSRINGAIASITMQLQGAFIGALMASGIALMTFMFKITSVIETFKEFEKELINAQSIFQTTDDILFGLSDQIVDFGTKYGVSLQDASEGLYTFASAGLTAEESQQVLQNTLKLSMAVQGDHETIAKLTTQTIFGFGLQMSDSAELTDKFAHAINKSLIEYQDLASAVKFAMPFFITTGQNIDQLLGSLEILTNRALEAGIAGRGLRQALSEFAQHADDNTASFAKLGVKVTDANGNFLMLTEIAKNFQTQFKHIANDTELLTTLLDDLNVRGATAFVHLVQNADEFQAAVDDLANSAGSATEMADIQQQSLANQIQVIKNALLAPFLLSDEVGKANGTLNVFSMRLHEIALQFESFFITRTAEGTVALTDMGVALRDIVLVSVEEMAVLLQELMITFTNLTKGSTGLGGTLHALLLPIKLLVKGINLLGEGGLQAVMMFKVLNSLLPLTQTHTIANAMSMGMLTQQVAINELALEGDTLSLAKNKVVKDMNTRSTIFLSLATAASHAMIFAGMLLINKQSDAYQKLGYVLLMVAGAYMAVNIAKAAGYEVATKGLVGLVAAGAVGAGVMAGFGMLMKKAMTPPALELPPMADTGMRMYDMGGKAGLGGRHFPVMVEPGESVISKTQNMLGSGVSGGITLNIGGDIVTNNAEDFAERIAIALPEALRKQNTMGGI